MEGGVMPHSHHQMAEEKHCSGYSLGERVLGEDGTAQWTQQGQAACLLLTAWRESSRVFWLGTGSLGQDTELLCDSVSPLVKAGE